MESDIIYSALLKKFEAEKLAAKANIEVYLGRSVGVAEHPDVIETMDGLVEKYCAAAEKLERFQSDFESRGN